MERRKSLLLAAILLLSLYSHLRFFFADHSSFVWDSSQYWDSAQHIRHGEGFRDSDGKVEGRRTPGYPLFLVPFQLLGLSPRSVTLLQHFFAIGIAWYVGHVVKRITSSTLMSLVAMLYVGIDPGIILMSNLVMAETLLGVMLVDVVYLLSTAARDTNWKRLLFVSLLLGASVLVKPVTIYLFIPLTLWLLVAWGSNAKGQRIIAAIVLLLASNLIPALWMLRNQRQFGSAMISSIIGEDLYAWRAAGVVAMKKTGFSYAPLPFSGQEEAFRYQFFRVTQRQMAQEGERLVAQHYGRPYAQISEVEKSVFLGPLGRKIILENFGWFLLLSINGALHLVFDGSWDFASRSFGFWRPQVLWLMYFETLLSFPLAIIGIVYLWRRIDARFASLILLTLTYYVAVSSGPEYEQWRYRVPAIPIYAMAIAAGVAALIRNANVPRSGLQSKLVPSP